MQQNSKAALLIGTKSLNQKKQWAKKLQYTNLLSWNKQRIRLNSVETTTSKQITTTDQYSDVHA